MFPQIGSILHENLKTFYVSLKGARFLQNTFLSKAFYTDAEVQINLLIINTGNVCV